MLKIGNSDILLEKIREGEALNGNEKLRLIVLLSIPSILAQITSVVMFFIDQAMVGRISVEAAAACGLVETSTWLFGSITSAASMGFSVQVAHAIGANNFERARMIFSTALIATTLLIVCIAAFGLAISSELPFWLGGGADIASDASTYFGVFMFALPFFQLANLCGAILKCSGNMRIPSITSIAMCVMDVVFNFILVFVFHLGVLGIALGTAIAIVIGGLLQAFFAIRTLPLVGFSTLFAPREKALRPRSPNPAPKVIIFRALKIGSPMALQSVLMSGAQMVSTIIVAPLGNIAIAANTFAITAESLCYMPGYGISDAATTLVGQSIGAGRRDLCMSFARMTVFSGMIVMTLMGALMYVSATELMALMTPVASIYNLGASVLRIEAFAEPFFAASIVSYYVFVGAGDTLRPAIMNLGSMWIVRLSLAAILAQEYGLQGVWIAMAIELTFRGTIFLVRLFSGKWIKIK